jgi:hypothetical protein
LSLPCLYLVLFYSRWDPNYIPIPFSDHSLFQNLCAVEEQDSS